MPALLNKLFCNSDLTIVAVKSAIPGYYPGKSAPIPEIIIRLMK